MSKNQELFQRAKKVMPWGVSGNFRYWGEDDTPVITRGAGSHIWDADGREYIDYRLGFGPVILGHCDPRVTDRVAEAITRLSLFAHTHPLEISVAERMVRMCPGVESVRFANSGTEATMHALRLARAHTNREKLVMFEGCYHGLHDYVLFSTMTTPAGSLGSRRSPLAVPNSSGIPIALRDLVIVLPYNDSDMLERTVKARWGEIAAIMVEPIAGSMACVMPEPGWLEHIRRLCDAHGIVLILDEVKTGFRVARGGAAELLGIRGDLVAYAKAFANGFPLAAIGGSKDVMGTIEPGAVAHGGTYCGNVAGTAAAEATLEILETTDALAKIHRVGSRLMAGIGEVLAEAGLEHQVLGVPAMFCFVLKSTGKPRDFRAVRACDQGLYMRLSKAMRERGVEFNPTPAPWMLCEAHTDQDVDATLNALNDALKAVMA